MYEGSTLRLTALDDGWIELCFDRRDGPVNKFDRTTVSEWRAAIDRLQSGPAPRGVLVTSAKDSFVVGADITEFTALFASSEAGVEALNAGQAAVFAAFAALPWPTVAAVNGLAFGGGLELALACDARVAADTASVGLPEVTLGIVPAYGGSVRLPRLVGMATALAWVTSGKPRTAAEALHDGVLDAVVPAAELRATALAWLRDATAGRHDWRARRQQLDGPAALDTAALEQARERAAALAPRQPAPLAFVDFITDTAALPAAAARVEEAKLFARLAKTEAAAARVRLFLNDQFLKKQARTLRQQGAPVRQAAVLGAGIMGGGIAFTSALHGVPAWLKDLQQTALTQGLAEADRLLAAQVSQQRLTASKAAEVRAAIHPTLDAAPWREVDVVVEAIVENLAVKQQVLAALEPELDDACILASNTSSLSIGALAAPLRRPERLVGMHFFNPVPAMPLVEVICGPATDPAAAARVAGYALTMGKTPIVVQDCPGFLVNRILAPYMVAFLRLLHDGADLLQVDRVMEAFGWPMGPGWLQDVIGHDTLLHVLEQICGGYGERMPLDFAHAVQALVKEQRLGQKRGVGYYRYERDARGRLQKQVDPETPALLAAQRPGPAQTFTDAEIVDRMMLPLLFEAARTLDEGVARSAVEVDMGLILGLGFPRHLGGALHWADRQGLAALAQRGQRWAALSPIYQPAPGWLDRVATGRGFHGE